MSLALALFLSITVISILGLFWVYSHYYHLPKTKMNDDQSKRIDEMEKNINRLVIKAGIQPR